jgi:hypothetical protein
MPCMRGAVLSAVLAVAVAPGLFAQGRDPLAHARLLYNERDFEAAIVAAEEARQDVARADSADLVAARAYLERYRATSAPVDLANGRERLRRLNPDHFSGRERIEYIIGLGEALYLDNSPGAAASLFASVLQDPSDAATEAREHVLDWWASALDRQARPHSELDRRVIYERVRDRMRTELATNPGSAAAAYWLAAAAAGQGDWQAAWDAVQAGWVRAPLTHDQGTGLRADLDRLMLRAVVPERAKVLAQPAHVLLDEWDAFKQAWTR